MPWSYILLSENEQMTEILNIDPESKPRVRAHYCQHANIYSQLLQSRVHKLPVFSFSPVPKLVLVLSVLRFQKYASKVYITTIKKY